MQPKIPSKIYTMLTLFTVSTLLLHGSILTLAQTYTDDSVTPPPDSAAYYETYPKPNEAPSMDFPTNYTPGVEPSYKTYEYTPPPPYTENAPSTNPENTYTLPPEEKSYPPTYGQTESEQIPYTYPSLRPSDESTAERPYRQPPIQNFLPLPCQNANIQTPEECKNFMLENAARRGIPETSPPLVQPERFETQNKQPINPKNAPRPNFLPQECKEANINDMTECKKFMIEKKGIQMQEAYHGDAFKSPEDRERVQEGEGESMRNQEMGPEHSKENMFLPPECEQEGLTTITECKKHMFSRFAPTECKEAGASSEEDCKRVMIASHLPEPCKKAELTDEGECRKTMFKENAPKHCVEAGAENQEECEKLTFKKFAPETCLAAGLTDPRSCEKHLKEKVMPEECEKLGIKNPAQCEKEVFKQHAPKECKDQGAQTQKQCEKIIRADFQPKECKEANATTKESCEKVMFAKYAPPDCLAAGAENEESCHQIMFAKHAPKPCQDAGATSPHECKKVMFVTHAPPECKEADAADEESCRKILFQKHAPRECLEQGAATPEECEKNMIERYLPEPCRAVGATTPNACEKVMAARHLPEQCKEAKIDDTEACEKHVNALFMPKICKDADIKTPYECEIFVLEKNGRPIECQNTTDHECLSLIKRGVVKAATVEGTSALPPFCEGKGIVDPKMCEEEIIKNTIPPECREAGAFTRESCEKIMFEKYSQGEHAKTALPRECATEGITSRDACQELLQTRFFPKECKEAGITNEKSCQILLRHKHMPTLCKDKGIETIEACEEFLRSDSFPAECREHGILDTRACETLVGERYGKGVACEGLNEEQCQFAIQKRMLGRLASKKKENEAIEKKLDDFIGKHVTTKEAPDVKEALPVELTETTSVLILPAKEATVIASNEEIIDVMDAVVTIDSDKDNLPNEMENNLGSDPHTEDTDGDGVLDGVEAAAGFNPAGSGGVTLSETEQAIINHAELEQPIIEGDASDDLSIETGDPVVAQSNGESVPEKGAVQGAVVFAKNTPISFQGRALPNRTYALFIYSSFAIVTSVKSNDNGIWDHVVDAALHEGEHTAYLTELSKDGKIISKSAPLLFFVGVAEGAETLAEEAPEPIIPSLLPLPVKEPEQKLSTTYTYIGVIIALCIAIGLAIFKVRQSRKK